MCVYVHGKYNTCARTCVIPDEQTSNIHQLQGGKLGLDLRTLEPTNRSEKRLFDRRVKNDLPRDPQF